MVLLEVSSAVRNRTTSSCPEAIPRERKVTKQKLNNKDHVVKNRRQPRIKKHISLGPQKTEGQEIRSRLAQVQTAIDSVVEQLNQKRVKERALRRHLIRIKFGLLTNAEERRRKSCNQQELDECRKKKKG